MSQQWLRHCRLVVSTDGGSSEAIDLSLFRIRFKITQALVNRPCTAEITISNVSQSTASRINLNAFEANPDSGIKVILEAGYEENFGTIFSGDLWWKATGRENQTDTYLKLIATTGNNLLKYLVINTSLPPGATQKDILELLKTEFETQGVDVTTLPDGLLETQLPRGKVIYKASGDLLRGLSSTNNFYFSLGVNGLIFTQKAKTYDQGEPVVVLNSKTGLIGRPTITPNGVELDALLNPQLEVGALVQIDNASIMRQDYVTTISEGAYVDNFKASDAMLDSDGIYRNIGREHHGDTRGDEWRTHLICVGVTASVQPAASVANFGTN